VCPAWAIGAVASEAAAIIRLHARQAVAGVLGIGGQLERVKAALGHGLFLAWLAAEFGWSDDTARNLMNAWRAFKNRTVRDLEPIDVSALYLLAAPSTPEAVREEALGERLGSGGPGRPAPACRLQRVPAAGLDQPPGDREPDQGEVDVLGGMTPGQRRDDGGLGARHAVREQL